MLTNRYKLFACIALTILQLPAFAWGKGDTSGTRDYPIADGTFIQDYLVKNWDDKRWAQEFNALKEAGMHFLILAPAVYTDKQEKVTSIFPSSTKGITAKYKADLIENCLRNAKKAGFKVFLGLNFHESWWEQSFTPRLYTQMEIGNYVADELVSRYKRKYGDTMYGWYWVWEVDNIHFNRPDLQDVLVKTLNINLDHLHSITPDMPFMLSPFMNYKLGTAKAYAEMWKYVFAEAHLKKGDIFAPQDCIGAGGLTLTRLSEWFKELHNAVITKPGLLFWSNAETFDQRFWTIAPLNRFIEQMKIVNPYVSNFITFSYSHYYSPFTVSKNIHKNYLYYVKTGRLAQSAIPPAVPNLKYELDSACTIHLSWHYPKTTKAIMGYYIFRNGSLVGNVQQNSVAVNKFTQKGLLKDKAYLYEVCAYNYNGETSKTRTIKVTTKRINN